VSEASVKSQLFPIIVLFAFAVSVGNFAFRTTHPPIAPDYMLAAKVRPFSLPDKDPSGKHLYLRRTWHLTRVPEHAYVQLLGHDVLELQVNGRLVGRTERINERRIAALVMDITPFVHIGKNSIAIHAAQSVLDRPPAVAIEARCEFADGSRLSLDDGSAWRATNVYDRRGAFWYETEFEDDHWARPEFGASVAWRGQIALPARAITIPRYSQWIQSAKTGDGATVLARSFDVPDLPRGGWLRVLATGPYCLAVNGWIVADDHRELGLLPPYEPIEHTFDISPLLQSGTNTVSMSVTTAGEAPRVRADLEATTSDGRNVYIGTDEKWRSISGSVADWHRLDPIAHPEFEPCQPEIGYMGVIPQQIRRELRELNLPYSFWARRWASHLGLMAICGLVGWAGCRLTGLSVRRLAGASNSRVFSTLPFIALLPSAILAAVAWLSMWDPSWTAQDIYRPVWLLALGLLVLMQWLLLVFLAPRRSCRGDALAEDGSPTLVEWRHVGLAACWLIVAGVSLWLRLRDITAEPIHHDEISAYAFTQSVLERGVPGGQVHPDLPFGYCSTSELAYYPTALCALFVDDPRLVLRIPAVFWSMATLMLIVWMGSRWFNVYVGLVAAVLYGLSPHAIGWANLGRYLSQVQFFTLLTMYFTYEAFRGSGPIRKGMLWAAAVSVSAMYLSWEGSGMFGIGLALAVLILRRDSLRPVVTSPSLYAAIVSVLVVVAAQNAHRISQQTQRLWYGEGISDLAIKPMWRYPFFDGSYYLMNASWLRDSLLPMLALAAACFFAVRHRWRIPLRFSIICLATNALLMSALLPLRTNRYSYHLLPILVLLAAAALVAALEIVWRLGRNRQLSFPQRFYVRAIAASALIVFIGIASGRLIHTSELEDFQVAAFDVRQLRYPHWDGPTEYLRKHMRDGDAVIATFPHTQNFLLAMNKDGSEPIRQVDYWLESTLVIQATLGDTRTMPLDRRSGTAMIYDIEQLKHVFSQHDRVWYCTARFGQSRINDNAVSRFLRQNMDVVYEDYATAVLLRDNNHRTAPLQLEEDEAGRMASEFYLR
jgi:hypothetical protein